MGRRTLRRIDPNLDFRDWLLDEQQLPDTLSSQSLFGRDRPLELEVGSGKGLFLSRATGARPEHDFVGIEISRKYARFAAARLAKLERTNGKLIHGDGTRIVRERIRDRTLAAVHIYFPDPWWKTRHRKRRLMAPDFVRHLERVLEPCGCLHFWTDVREYFRATLELLTVHTSLTGPHIPDEQPATHDLDYQTHFERRMRLHDESVHRAWFMKP